MLLSFNLVWCKIGRADNFVCVDDNQPKQGGPLGYNGGIRRDLSVLKVLFWIAVAFPVPVKGKKERQLFLLFSEENDSTVKVKLFTLRL